jgi:hypothetical protein
MGWHMSAQRRECRQASIQSLAQGCPLAQNHAGAMRLGGGKRSTATYRPNSTVSEPGGAQRSRSWPSPPPSLLPSITCSRTERCIGTSAAITSIAVPRTSKNDAWSNVWPTSSSGRDQAARHLSGAAQSLRRPSADLFLVRPLGGLRIRQGSFEGRSSSRFAPGRERRTEIITWRFSATLPHHHSAKWGDIGLQHYQQADKAGECDRVLEHEAQDRALMSVPVGCGRGDYDRLCVDHLAHDAAR